MEHEPKDPVITPFLEQRAKLLESTLYGKRLFERELDRIDLPRFSVVYQTMEGKEDRMVIDRTFCRGLAKIAAACARDLFDAGPEGKLLAQDIVVEITNRLKKEGR